MVIKKRKLFKNATLTLTGLIICVTTTYSMNPNGENINNIINNSNNTVNSQSLQNISNNNSNNNNSNISNRSLSIYNRTDNNSNKPMFLCRKTNRHKRKSKNNVTFTYTNFNKANKILKTLIEKEKNELQTDYNNYNDNEKLSPQAKRCFNKIKDLTKLCNKNFPVLGLQNRHLRLIGIDINDYFNLKNILEQIKLLKSKIKREMYYEDCNEFKDILYQINNNQQMDKKLYNKLVNIGLIKQNKFCINFYESAKQIETVKKQQEVSETFCKIHNKINDTNNINEIKNNFEQFYKIITDLNNIKTIFTHHSDVAEVVQKSVISNINNILNNNNMKNKIMPFGIEKTLFTFKTMKEFLISGHDVPIDYSQSIGTNYSMFKKYYKDMLYKSEVFYKQFGIEVGKISNSLNELAQYHNDNTAMNMKVFLTNNKRFIYDKYHYMLNICEGIFRAAFMKQIKTTKLIELLTEIKNKLNSGDELKEDGVSYDFIPLYLITDNSNININNIQILKDIMSTEYFKNIITVQRVKDTFQVYYNRIRYLVREGLIQENNILSEYINSMKRSMHVVICFSNALVKMRNMINIKLPEGLDKILSDYISDLQKSVNIEYKKYTYASKFIIDIDKAIVPAGFWDNKLIK